MLIIYTKTQLQVIRYSLFPLYLVHTQYQTYTGFNNLDKLENPRKVFLYYAETSALVDPIGNINILYVLISLLMCQPASIESPFS